MKKTVLSLLVMALAAGTCFADDGKDLQRDQKVADTVLAVFAGGSKAPAYKTVSASFTAQLKEKLGEKEFADVKKQVGDKFGQMSESKFVAFERFDKVDRLTYFAGYTKEKVVAMSFGFDKEGKLFEFRLSPVKPQPAPGEAGGSADAPKGDARPADSAAGAGKEKPAAPKAAK